MCSTSRGSESDGERQEKSKKKMLKTRKASQKVALRLTGHVMSEILEKIFVV